MKEFETGQAPVVPPPSPWDSLARWGSTGEVPKVPAPPTRRRKGPPTTWAVAVIGALCFLALCSVGGVLVSAMVEDPEQSRRAPAVTGSPAAPAVPVAQAGSREEPYRAGEVFTLPGWEISLGATVSGKKAVNTITKANQFNEIPAKGQTFVIVPVTVKRTEGDSIAPWLSVSVRFLAPDGVVLDGSESYCGVVPKPFNDLGEMFPGASAKGNVCVQTPSAAVAEGIWIVEPLIGFTDRHRVYVDTGQ